ncbi:MAG: RIP metalloprotease RseP [Candidatus Omnitrophica bacterium]|nr:RIP metalloprotease RseP [Candidatus Omnitrophota bacterium]
MLILIIGILLKALIILAIFSVLIIVHEAGHFFAALRAGVRVERFALGFGKKIFSIKRGKTEYSINIIPLGGYVKLAGENPYERKGGKDEFYSKPVRSRFGVIVAGPIANYLLAFFILVGLYMVGMPTLTSEIGRVLDSSPALSAGLKSGDMITAIDNKQVNYWQEVVQIIRADKEALPLAIQVKRGTETINMQVTPRIIKAENIFKQKHEFVGIGIAPSEKVIMLKTKPFNSFNLAAKHVWFFTAATYKGIWLLVTGAMPIKENVGGPIRIVSVISSAIKYGWYSVLSITATISLALAIFNLLPFPILDGGHILFLGIEKLRGRPLSEKAQEIMTQVALFLLIAFFLYVSYYDVRAVTGFGK